MVPRPDVAIVGAGPAGAWAAYKLALAGARVVVFDASHPREKPCGGGVTGRALDLIREVLDAVHVPAVVVSSARFEREDHCTRSGARGFSDRSAGNGPDRSTVVPLFADGVSPASSLTISSRSAFDAMLLTAALGAGAVRVPERVVDVAGHRNGALIRTTRDEYRTSILLGADGANSLVRRRVRHSFTRAQLSIATGVYARGVTSDQIVIRLLTNPPGYLWSFPRPDHLAIGICAPADAATSTALHDRTVSWLRESRLAEGATLTRYAWPIPSLGPDDFDREEPAAGSWMLLGDAAGLVDPITREGIFFALQSGAWAAEALLGPHARAASAYTARLRDEIYPELRRAAMLRSGFFRPEFTGLLADALATSASIRAVTADLIAGRQPYRGLARRLLGTREFGLAWRLLCARHLLRPES